LGKLFDIFVFSEGKALGWVSNKMGKKRTRAPWFSLGAPLTMVCRGWQSVDWPLMDQLHQKGYLSNPANRNKSLELTREGLAEAERLAKKVFSSAFVARSKR